MQVKITKRAVRQITQASRWWDAERPAAPGAIEDALRGALNLISVQPLAGSRIVSARVPGVRRVYLASIKYHLYYRVRPRANRVDVLAFWHATRGSGPL